MANRLGIVFVLLALAMIALSGCGGGTPAPSTPAATPAPTQAALAPTPPPIPSPSPTARPTTMKVGNTDGDGVWVRKSPTGTERLRAWPDGTLMTVVGADQTVEGRTWTNVKDPAGNVGWVPSQYLVAAPTATPTRAAPTKTPTR